MTLTAPSPTQKSRLWLHRGRAGGEDNTGREGSKPGINAVWPLAVRLGESGIGALHSDVALKVSIHSDLL